jgi:chain length determinant protein EpsF
MSLRHLLLILRARWQIALVTLLCTVAVAVAASLLLPEQYTATTSVVVDVKSPDPVAGIMLPALVMPGYMATQVDIINSDRVALRVVGMLRLAENPQAREAWQDDTAGKGKIEVWLGKLLQKKLTVKPSRESNVITISFVGAEPQFAAAVANAFAQAYIDTTLDLRVEPAKQYAAWFEARTKQLRENLQNAQQALSAYQREKGIFAADERIDHETTRLNEISSQLTQIQALRTETSSRQRQAGAGNSDMQEVLQNPLISGLTADLARAEAKLPDAQARLGTNHPEYIKLQSEIGSLRARITFETGRVASSLGTANRVNVQREAELSSALGAQKAKVLQLHEARDRLAVLQRDLESAQRAHELVAQRLAQTNLESQTQQTNVAVLTRAEAPVDPSFPKLLLNTFIAAFLGTMLAAGAALLRELTQRRVRSAEHLGDTLGLPVLAVLGKAALAA